MVLVEQMDRRSKMNRMKDYPEIDRVCTGKRIKRYMDALGLTARDIQDYLQLGSVQSVYHWLEGKSLPTMDNLFAMSVLLGATIDDLICSEQKPPVIFYDYTYSDRIGWYHPMMEECSTS